MTSHEVSLAYGDMRRVSELEAQLASAQAAALLAQADAEALRAERDQWQQKCREVGQELAQWLDALNEWADTNSRAELTGADRKLFALAEEGRS